MVSSSAVTRFLTILVPTYNRAALLQQLLEALCPLVAASGAADRIEVVVADNVSTDATPAVAQAFAARYSFLRHWRKPVHWDSGEGNIFSSVPQLKGEYVWTLGDDDFLLPDCLETLLAVLQEHQPGFVLFNNGLWSAERQPLVEAYLLPSHPVLRFDSMSALVAGLGFCTAPTTFSSTVWRRQELAQVPWRDYNRASSAYSHVAIYLEAFATLPSLLVERPLIGYRFVPQEATRSFARWSREHRLGKLFPWHLGIVRLFDLLVRRGVVPPGYFWTVTETPLDTQVWKGSFAPLHLNVLSELHNQVQYALSACLPGEFLTAADWGLLEGFFQACPHPEETAFLAGLKTINDAGGALCQYSWTAEADGAQVARRQRLLQAGLTRFRAGWAELRDQLRGQDPASGAVSLGLHGSEARMALAHCRPFPHPVSSAHGQP